ncbi:MAG: RDD family protein [Beijerinckiaceae bacterium]
MARIWAFVIDFVVISTITVVLWLLVAMAGILTLGLTWLALPLVAPFTAFFYNALTVSGPRRGTWGMRVMDLEVTTVDGHGLDFIGAGAHALFFWLSMYVTSGFAILFGLFHPQSRQLHDILTRSIVTRRAY